MNDPSDLYDEVIKSSFMISLRGGQLSEITLERPMFNAMKDYVNKSFTPYHTRKLGEAFYIQSQYGRVKVVCSGA